MTEQQANKEKIFRVQGFSCAGCAQRFEDNVKDLDGVEEAKVNFGAAKIMISGTFDMKALEKEAAKEKLQLLPAKSREVMPEAPFWKKYASLFIAAVFLICGYLLNWTYGEDEPLTIGAFVISILAGGYSLFLTGLKNLVRLKFDMKTLMTIAIIGAAIIGEWSEGAVVVILFGISEALEGYSMNKARRSITSLLEIAPKKASIRRNGSEILIDTADISVGDIMVVRPGEKIAMDGIVSKGVSTINQAAITGESIPVGKAPGDEVFAGTLNVEGLLDVKVTKLAEDTTISKMIHLVEEAQAERAPAQAFVDVFAKYYTPVIIVIAFLVAVIPPVFTGADWQEWIYQGLAVLVVGCPCALVISTPVAIVTAIGTAAKHGVLIKGGVHLEQAGKSKVIAFDKTGTLTKGIPAVTDYSNFNEEDNLFASLTALEAYSRHPLSHAFMKKAEEDGLDYHSLDVDHFESVTGKGIKGTVDGKMLMLGNKELFRGVPIGQDILHEMERWQSEGKTVMLAGNMDGVKAMIAVADEVRESSRDVIRRLHALGIQKTVMLTGDTEATAKAIGDYAGVTETAASLLPEQKLDMIKKLKQAYKDVVMVGDGVNDAPALAAASLGIAMGGVGSDTALETADVALMGDDLQKLPFLITLSRKAMRIIKQNITFAIGIKIVALLLVVPGWLTLWIAIFADLGATLIVTLNGIRLMKVKK